VGSLAPNLLIDRDWLTCFKESSHKNSSFFALAFKSVAFLSSFVFVVEFNILIRGGKIAWPSGA
jgi:hypothetical protein